MRAVPQGTGTMTYTHRGSSPPIPLPVRSLAMKGVGDEDAPGFWMGGQGRFPLESCRRSALSARTVGDPQVQSPIKGITGDTGGKNAFIQGLHGDYIVIF